MLLKYKDGYCSDHKMLFKRAFLVCFNGCVNRWMISPSCDGKQALIIHSDLLREPQHSARRSPVEVINWSGLVSHRKSHLLTWIQEMCWWVQNYTFLQCIWACTCTANARVTLPGCGRKSCQIRAEWNIFKPKQTEIFFEVVLNVLSRAISKV